MAMTTTPPQGGDLYTSDKDETIAIQGHMILFLRTQYDQMKKRMYELIDADRDLRDLLRAYVSITRDLSKRENLTQSEVELLKSFESPFTMLKKSKGLDKANNNGKSVSISELLGSNDMGLKSRKKALSPNLSHIELPSSHNGHTVSDVTIIKKRKSLICNAYAISHIKEEHPNLNILLKFPLFANMPENIMERIATSCYEVRKKQGQIVINKGEEAAEIFFLLEGVVSVELTDTNHIVLRPISFFGELGVLFKFKRTATVRAMTDCVLLVVTKQRMDEAMMQDEETKKIVENFAVDQESWWKQQKYVAQQERFGAEFVQDIARKDLRKVPIFADAPESFIQSLAMKTQCFIAEENQIIVSIGEDSDAIYFILSGVLEVVGEGGVVHAEMTDGAFFGEVGVLLDLKRTASIRAKVKSNYFKLAKSDLDSVISVYPAMKLVLEKVANERYEMFKQRTNAPQTTFGSQEQVPDQFDVEIGTQSLAKLSIFRGVDTSVVNQLSMKMIRKNWSKSEHIINCGDIGDGMYFLAAGDAEVITEFGEVIDNVSGPSAYFGEVALLEHVPRTASIKCTSVCSTYELKKTDFLAVLANYPVIAAHIKETAHARMQKYLMRNTTMEENASTPTPQQMIANFQQQIETQNKMIEFMLSQYDQMKKRNLELINQNNEIRELIRAYIIITRNLSKRDNLSQTERDLLKSFEQVQFLLRTSQEPATRAAEIGSEPGSVSHLVGRPLNGLLAKKKIAQSRDLSHFEIPSISNSGRPVSDVTIIKRRKSFVSPVEDIKEEYPNMETLLKFPLFEKLPESAMERIAASCYEVRKKAGQVVINKGEEAAEIFFLLEGTVAVQLEDSRRTHLKPGSFFGELGVLFKFKRTATVTAITDCTVLVVMKTRLDEAINSDPKLQKIVEEFAADKEAWWKGQKYIVSQAGFGAEFAQDIARKDIKKLPIFGSAPENFVQSLAMKIQCFVAEENQNIVSIGEESDAIYFILSGVLEVVGENGIVHAEMTDGAFFGEVGVLLELKRTASIRAKAKSHIFKLAKSDLDGVIEEFPAMQTALEEVALERYQLFKQRKTGKEMEVMSIHVTDFDIEIGSQSLAKVSQIHNLLIDIYLLSIKQIIVEHIPRNRFIIHEKIINIGDVGDGMFFLAAGNAEVIADTGAVIDEVSGPSAYFGEVALLEHIPRTATVKCTSVCSTYELKQSDFLAVIENYPEIAMQIKATADARMQKTSLTRNAAGATDPLWKSKCVPKILPVDPPFQATCEMQPCWASTLLCQDPQTTCRVAALNSPCFDSRFRMPPGAVKPPQPIPLTDFNTTGLIFNVPFLPTPVTSQSTTAVSADAFSGNEGGNSSGGGSIGVIAGSVGGGMFILGILVAFIFTQRRKRLGKSGRTEEGEEYGYTDTSSYTRFASSRGPDGDGEDGRDFDELEMHGLPRAAPHQSSSLQAHLQRRAGGAFDSKQQVPPRLKGFRDDFFDDASVYSHGNSTHISIATDEVRPFELSKLEELAVPSVAASRTQK
ncbi:UNVERIFIED_CONTAM: hypothetical protein HDU68_004340 [Siphonaria sp. JEL0065]|nr:hypothetical protein HDU68_004340 [Siphonaria sp. JEL0065]